LVFERNENMSKHFYRYFIVVIIFVFLLSACTPPASTPLAPTVIPVTQTVAPVVQSPTPAPVNIALGKSVTASHSASGQPAENAVDGNPDTAWRSGANPEQWIQIDLGAPSTVKEIRLVTYQIEEGQTTHRILAGSSESDLQLVHDFNDATADRQELVFTPMVPLTNIRFLRIVTIKAPGYVAWRDVQVLGILGDVAAVPTSVPQADTIYYNGQILTMESDHPTAEAIAIKGDRILAVGSQADVFAYQGSSTVMIDLQGLTATPGFIDSHEHRIGDRWLYADTPPSVEPVFAEILKEGYTSIHEMWVNSDRLNELVNLDSQGKLPVRVSMYLKMNSEFSIDNWWQAYQPLHQYSPYLQIAGLKITLDREWGQKIFIENQQDLNAVVQSGTSRGWQIATHSFSPTANQLILNAYGNALNGGSNDTLRLRIEHIGTMTDPELQQMADLHIIGSVQLISTASYVDDPSFKTQIPAELVPLTGRWRDLINAGVFLIGNTDAPWCCTGWRNNVRNWGYAPTVPQSIYQGVTRTTFTGRTPEAWQTAQVVTVQEALEMMTIHSAYAAHQENVIGSLKAGKYADMVILSANPLIMPTAQLPNMQVLMTMVGGKVEYCLSGHDTICTATP
jgi:predicted amidohydrolase YtcJ